MGRTYIALDTEATGLRADTDEIIEIGAVKFRDGQVLDHWQSFIRPSQPIPYKITALTGITCRRTCGARPRITPWPRRCCASSATAASSATPSRSTCRCCTRQGVRMRNRSYDTFELATLLLPEVRSITWWGWPTALGVPCPTQHRAVADAELAMHVFEALVGRLRELPLEVLAEINRATATSEWPLRFLFQEVEREDGARRVRDAAGAGGRPGGKLAAAGFSQTEFDLGLIQPPPLPPAAGAPDESAPTRPVDGPRPGGRAGAPAARWRATFPAYEIRPAANRHAALGRPQAFNERPPPAGRGRHRHRQIAGLPAARDQVRHARTRPAW